MKGGGAIKDEHVDLRVSRGVAKLTKAPGNLTRCPYDSPLTECLNSTQKGQEVILQPFSLRCDSSNHYPTTLLFSIFKLMYYIS